MKTLQDLEQTLRSIDGKGYKAYKDIRGGYAYDEGWLFVDYVQGDPFASPSKMRIRMPQQVVQLPDDLKQDFVRRLALEDLLARRVHRLITRQKRSAKGTGKSGMLAVDAGYQQVLERTAVRITENAVEVRLEAGLPARGRSVLGLQAMGMLCEALPELAGEALTWSDAFAGQARRFVECVENQEAIRSGLQDKGLVAFIADGAMLPRASGVSDQPLDRSEGVPFESPDPLRVSFELPHPAPDYTGEGRMITGMGIPQGVTLIVGGGYHGKSTLLRALERGVYPHVPGDGREYVVTDPHAVKIRAEDRRRIEGVDVSPYISGLPNGQPTRSFRTEEASGSTSQAAAFQEALEAGAEVFLVDEDTSATNLMIRDARMQRLVARPDEPITPFLDRVRELCDRHGVSTVQVMGGAGDYFDVADTVIMMKEYRPYEVTDRAREISEQFPSVRTSDSPESMETRPGRIPDAESVDPSRDGKIKLDAPATERIRYGRQDIDLRCVEQLVDPSQSRCIAYALYHASQKIMDVGRPLSEVLDALEQQIDRHGLEALSPFSRSGDDYVHPGNLARPRRHEMAAALNRLRTLRVAAEEQGRPAR